MGKVFIVKEIKSLNVDKFECISVYSFTYIAYVKVIPI